MPRGRPKKTQEDQQSEEMQEGTKLSDFGPDLYKRDENGLLLNSEYKFNEDGSIDWRAMIKDEYLFPNKSWFELRNKEMPSSTDGLEDHQLLIKLGGIKELAKLRGFKNVTYKFQKCEESHVAVTCGINFIGNYETGGEVVYFEDAANATLNNTSSFATKFLETIACNRAFVRCVRNFLNIHIVGDDEIDKSNKTTSTALSPLTPNSVLENKFSDFESLKEELRNLWKEAVKDNNQSQIDLLSDVKNWKSFSDIPPKEARLLIKIFK